MNFRAKILLYSKNVVLLHSHFRFLCCFNTNRMCLNHKLYGAIV